MYYAKSAWVLSALGATLIAMSAQSVAAVTSGMANGIDAGDAYGIDAGDTSGIDAGDALGIDAGDIAGIDAGDAFGFVDRSQVLAGPVDSIDRVNSVFQSMGQVVMASQNMLATLSVGDYVSVGGSVIASGWLYADDVVVSNQRYVPGSTEVFVSGMLSSINQMNGTAQMGDLTIDYTSSLGNAAAPSSIMWSFAGTRSGRGGVMTSDRSANAR